MPESLDELQGLSELHRQVERLAIAPDRSLTDKLDLLASIVHEAREMAERLESAGRHADALPIYDIINQAYDVAMEGVDPSEQQYLVPLRDFWRSASEMKRQGALQNQQAVVAPTYARKASPQISIEQAHTRHLANGPDKSFSVDARQVYPDELERPSSELHSKQGSFTRDTPLSSRVDRSGT